MNYSASKIYIITVIVLCISGFAHAQSAQDLLKSQMMQQQTSGISQPDVDVPSTTGESGLLRPSDMLPEGVELYYPEQSQILLDKTLDPDEYIVDAGDLLGIYFWGEIEREYPFRVLPEGFIVIPTVGSVDVAGSTFTEVRRIIKEAISKNYTDLDVSVFLTEPRRFRLMVSGMVYVPGMHESNAFERVSDIMDRAGIIVPGSEDINENNMQEIHISTLPGTEVAVSSTPGEAEQEPSSTAAPNRAGIVGRTQPGYLGRRDRTMMNSATEPIQTFTLGQKRGSSSRSIIIERDGKTLHADMLRFIKLGDLDANPYVNSGDQIKVPQYRGDITVYGQVHDQGIYEYKEGDRICDLIGFGGGLTSVADTSNAELIRFEPDGYSFDRITIDLYEAMYDNPDAPLYRLRESDQLNVKRKYEYKVLYSVTIDGEVKNPGQYTIKKNESTLTELIDLAGGFTGKENLDQARLIRQSSFAARDMEYERLKNLEVGERTPEENDYVRSYQRTLEGSVNIDFVRLFRDNDLSNDVVLQNGDAVYIPTINEYVNVIGAVKEPGYFKAQKGSDMEYYIEKAGGYNWDANKRERSLIKAKTAQRYKTRYFEVEIEGGDTIHIPSRVPRTFWQYFREYTGYATSVATIVLIAAQFSK